MSVTPDFVGQVYKDTTTGNIWRANSTTPGDWTLEVQNMQVGWIPHSSKLGQAIGFFTYGDLPGFTQLVFSGSTSIAGFDIEFQNDLLSISFPNLVSVDPTSTQSGGINIDDNPLLQTVDAPVLTTIGGSLNCYAHSSLTTLDISSLESVGGNIKILDNTILTTVDFSSLQSVGGQITGSNSTLLSSINLTAITSLGGNLIFNGCALSQSEVDGILAQLVSIPTYGAGKTIRLEGGTSSAPSAAGLVNKGILEGRGATVLVN